MFRFIKRKGWLIFLLAFLLLFPPALKSQAKLNNRVLITGLAIDKTESGYMITAQVVMPNPSSEASGQNAAFDFICQEGESITEGFKKVAYNIGEIAWHSHANFIILGEELIKKDNTAEDLDFFIRDQHLPNSLMLLFCKGKADDMIRKTAELKLSVGLGLQKIYMYKEESLSAKMVPMQTFLDNCYQPSKTSIISGINISFDDECFGSSGGGQEDGSSSTSSSGESSTSSSSSGDSSSSSGGESLSSASESGDAAMKGRIDYLENIAYFKSGRFKGTLEKEDEIIAYLLTQNKTDRFDLVIKNVNDDNLYKNAKVGIRVASKKYDLKMDFKGHKPLAKMIITLNNLSLLEVLNDNGKLVSTLLGQGPYINETLNSAIKKQLETDIKEVFEKTKKQNVDIFNLATHAYKYNTKDFQSFLKTKNNIDDYIEDFNLEVEVIVKDFIK
ncbi:MAG: hypothetical protein IJT25_01465 [Clostridia bacterium]|nr:hypothetical protein [Clostridia bacterium]